MTKKSRISHGDYLHSEHSIPERHFVRFTLDDKRYVDVTMAESYGPGEGWFITLRASDVMHIVPHASNTIEVNVRDRFTDHNAHVVLGEQGIVDVPVGETITIKQEHLDGADLPKLFEWGS